MVANACAVVGGVLFVLLLWKTSVFFPFKSEGILYGLLSIEAILSQIGVVGVITSALLSGSLRALPRS
ncbi:hypothetical protein EON67_03380 [archaeon]|nr:MAG: hypothetical protein EON67_03380 [archaeon]